MRRPVERRFTASERGADGGARTHNLRFRRPLLYPLSYARIALTIAYARPADKHARGSGTVLIFRSESPLTFHRPGGIIPFRSFQDVAHPRRCERRSPLHHQLRLFTCAPSGAFFMRSFSFYHERQSHVLPTGEQHRGADASCFWHVRSQYARIQESEVRSQKMRILTSDS
jgi:hypothetical protein